VKEFYNCASLNLSLAQSDGQWHLMYLRGRRYTFQEKRTSVNLATSIPQGRLTVIQGVAAYFQPSLRDWSSFQIQPRTSVLG
jgi:hypothetical protein